MELYSFFKRKQRLRLCKIIASRYARRTGRDHLRPKAPPGGPLARWHKPQLVLKVKIDSSPHGFARTMFGQPKHAKKAQRSFFRFARGPRKQRSKRAYTPRADVQSKIILPLRAHIQIQYLRAARAIRSKICSGCTHTKWLPPGRFSLSSLGRHVIFESEYVRESAVHILTA